MAEMLMSLLMMASVGLERLAWTGRGEGLADELNANGFTTSRNVSFTDFGPGVGGNNPTSEAFLTCANGTRESLASGGIELKSGGGAAFNGSKWAMYHPDCYPDHFLIEFSDGRVERWDVGSNEGDCRPFQVQVVSNEIQRMDGTVVPPGGRGNRGNCGKNIAEIFASAPDSTEEESGNDGNDNQNNSEQSTEEESGNNGNDNQNDSEQITEEESDGGNSNSSSGGGSDIGLAVGGVAVVGIAVYLLSGGTAADVSFAPDYGLHYTEDGGTEYFYGAKWEYEKANWRADWTAMRARKSESWRYASGVEWTAGVWRAAFGGENVGDKTAMDLSLAAERRAGGWMLKSAANANARFDEFGGEFAHYFSAAASRRISEWEISVSAAARDLDDNPALRADMIFTREF